MRSSVPSGSRYASMVRGPRRGDAPGASPWAATGAARHSSSIATHQRRAVAAEHVRDGVLAELLLDQVERASKMPDVLPLTSRGPARYHFRGQVPIEPQVVRLVRSVDRVGKRHDAPGHAHPVEDARDRPARLDQDDASTALARVATAQERLLERLGDVGEGMDPESRMRLRSIDVQMLRILEEISAGRQESMAELRTDIAALGRAMGTSRNTRPRGE